jgi:uncharacterized protein
MGFTLSTMASRASLKDTQPIDISHLVCKQCAADPLLCKVAAIVQDIMSKPPYDGSHDFSHIARVLENAEHILDEESECYPGKRLNHRLAILAAVLHDIGDRKYIVPRSRDYTPQSLLLELGESAELAATVHDITTHVSGKLEKEDKPATIAALLRHPELAVV